jgi:hypothetical protein
MIVDFIKLKRRLDRFAYGHLKGVHVRDGSFLNLMNRYIIHEGNSISYQTVDNETLPMNLEKIESIVELSREELRKLGVQEVLHVYESIASEILEKQHQISFARIGEAVASVGNTIDGTGKNFSQSTLEMLEKIHVVFDDDRRDRPQMPTLVVNPATAEKLKAEAAAMTPEEVEEHDRRQSQILDRKFEEHILRESNRKLVD